MGIDDEGTTAPTPAGVPAADTPVEGADELPDDVRDGDAADDGDTSAEPLSENSDDT